MAERKIKYAFYILLALLSGAGLLFLTSCRKENVGTASKPILFSLESGTLAETKGQDPLTDGSINEFTIYASYETASDFGPETGIGNYYGPQKAEKLSDGTFATAAKYFWPTTGKLSFFAFSPSKIKITVPSGQKGSLRISYTPEAENVINQEDLCVAVPLLNKTSADSPLPVVFNHTTTSVYFSAKYTDESGILSGYNLKIDKIVIIGVKGCRDIVISPKTTDYFAWEDNSSSSTLTSYTLSRAGQHLDNVALTTTMENLTLVNGRLYLLPQTLSGAKFGITYSMLRNLGTKEEIVSQFYDEVAIPDGTWAPATSVRYSITINLTGMKKITVTATSGKWIDEWTDSGSSTDKRIQ